MAISCGHVLARYRYRGSGGGARPGCGCASPLQVHKCKRSKDIGILSRKAIHGNSDSNPFYYPGEEMASALKWSAEKEEIHIAVATNYLVLSTRFLVLLVRKFK